jgi:hypothetical protein
LRHINPPNPPTAVAVLFRAVFASFWLCRFFLAPCSRARLACLPVWFRAWHRKSAVPRHDLSYRRTGWRIHSPRHRPRPPAALPKSLPHSGPQILPRTRNSCHAQNSCHLASFAPPPPLPLYAVGGFLLARARVSAFPVMFWLRSKPAVSDRQSITSIHGFVPRQPTPIRPPLLVSLFSAPQLCSSTVAASFRLLPPYVLRRSLPLSRSMLARAAGPRCWAAGRACLPLPRWLRIR